MPDLRTLSIKKARQALQKKLFSATELTRAYLSEIEKKQRKYNAYITCAPEKALNMAKVADQNIAKGKSRPLEGIPIGMKDLFCTKNIKTTAGSKMLKNFVPPYESTVSQNLWDQGAVMLGKLNMDEFAMGSGNLNSAFGDVKNPWDPSRVPGGSSGGSAAAVAANLCLGATGSDTGGSIRQPASFCGLVGFKPSYGRCSRWGMVAFASSLDQAGSITKTVEDSVLMLCGMASHDAKDATSSMAPLPDFSQALLGKVKGMRIGLPQEYMLPHMSEDIKKQWEKTAKNLRINGAEIKEVSLPHTSYGLPAYYIISSAEASSNLARYDGVCYGHRNINVKNLEDLYTHSRTEGFGAEVKRRIMIGTYVLSAGHYDAYYNKAQQVRQCVVNDFKTAFEDVDVLLTPTTPTEAFERNNQPTDPVTMYMNDVFTVPTSLAGLPAISVPVARSINGLPLGLQVIGPAYREDVVVRLACAIEQQEDFSCA